jgi:hypothetical protein
VEVENLLDRPLADARIVIEGTIYDLGVLPAQDTRIIVLPAGSGRPLSAFVQQYGSRFQEASEQRRSALGNEQAGQLENPSVTAMAASFPSYLPMAPHQRNCVAPAGLDMSPLVERGDSVLLAWAPGQSPVGPLNRFTPPIMRRDTLFRLAIPASSRRFMEAN